MKGETENQTWDLIGQYFLKDLLIRKIQKWEFLT